MLTGRYVFTGDTALQIVARHTSAEPTPPSTHSAFDVSRSWMSWYLSVWRRTRPTARGPPESWPNAYASTITR